MKYKFIGDENDKRTKDWGIKNGEVYELEITYIGSGLGPETPRFDVKIITDIGYIYCPYSSIKTFKKNWEKVNK